MIFVLDPVLDDFAIFQSPPGLVVAHGPPDQVDIEAPQYIFIGSDLNIIISTDYPDRSLILAYLLTFA